MPRRNPIQRCRAIGPSRGVSMKKPSSGADAAHTILTITDDGGSAMATTAAAHGLTEDTAIVISGNSVPGYNGAKTIGFVPSATTFYTSDAYTSDGTGGSWALA